MALLVHLPLTGDLHNQGLAEITYTGTPVFKTTGKIGNSAFDLSHRVVFNCPSLDGVKTFSIAFWAKVNSDSSLSGNWIDVASFTDRKSDGSTTGLLRWETCYSGTWGISSHDNSAYNISNLSNFQAVGKDIWHHIIITVDLENNEVKEYQNGIVQKTATCNGGSLTGAFHLGENNLINGEIQDVRIYDNVLSQLQISELKKALILHYSLDGNNGTLANENLLPETSSEEKTYTYPTSSSKDWYRKASLVPLTKSEYVLSFYAKSTVNGDKIITYFYNPNTTTKVETNTGINKTASDGNATFVLTTEWQKYWVKYTQSETTTTKYIICPRLINGDGTGTVSVKCVKLEEGHTPTPWCPNPSDALYTALGYDDGIEYDTSGYGHNGTKVGTLSYSVDSPRYLASTVFDGTQAIRLGRRLYDSVSQLTVTEWFKTNTRNSTSPNLFSLGENSFLRVRLNTNNTLWWYIKGQNDTYTAPSSLIDNKWHFFAITFNSGIVKMYLDGVLVETKDISSAMSEIVFAGSDATFWGLGGYSASAEKYAGHLSDFRVYSSCLSDTEIQKLYTVSASIDSNGNAYSAAYVEG